MKFPIETRFTPPAVDAGVEKAAIGDPSEEAALAAQRAAQIEYATEVVADFDQMLFGDDEVVQLPLGVLRAVVGEVDRLRTELAARDAPAPGM